MKMELYSISDGKLITNISTESRLLELTEDIYTQNKDYKKFILPSTLAECVEYFTNYCINWELRDVKVTKAIEKEKRQELQYEILQDMQAKGFNVVNCGDCGSVVLLSDKARSIDEEFGEEVFTCPHCDSEMVDSDCPDFYYDNWWV